MSERVLVVPTVLLHEIGAFHGFCPDVGRYLPHLLDSRNLSFLARGVAETEPRFKQLIPYVVLRCGSQVFHYTRGVTGTETRLQALASIGIGGHICAEDAEQTTDPYRAGMLREISEEIDLQSAYKEQTVGLINDDTLPVGRVHLGIVHIFDLAEPKVVCREDSLAGGAFAPVADLRRVRQRFETWSQFLLDDKNALGHLVNRLDSTPSSERP
jgi:predicted NUDIX family phosphoesterase